MSDFDQVKQLLLEFSNKVNGLKQTKVGNYSAKLELPEWRKDSSNFATDVSATVGKYRVHLELLEKNRLLPVEENKKTLTKLSNDVEKILKFYNEQWGQKHEKVFCDQLAKSLQDAQQIITSYTNSNRPRP